MTTSINLKHACRVSQPSFHIHGDTLHFSWPYTAAHTQINSLKYVLMSENKRNNPKQARLCFIFSRHRARLPPHTR